MGTWSCRIGGANETDGAEALARHNVKIMMANRPESPRRAAPADNQRRSCYANCSRPEPFGGPARRLHPRRPTGRNGRNATRSSLQMAASRKVVLYHSKRSRGDGEDLTTA